MFIVVTHSLNKLSSSHLRNSPPGKNRHYVNHSLPAERLRQLLECSSQNACNSQKAFVTVKPLTELDL
jgi:hypothetical protein